MTRKQFSEYTKKYGRQIRKWPYDLQSDAWSYKSERSRNNSQVFAAIGMVCGFVAIICQVISVLIAAK